MSISTLVTDRIGSTSRRLVQGSRFCACTLRAPTPLSTDIYSTTPKSRVPFRSSHSTCHGTASPFPPDGYHLEEYRLTTEGYSETIRAFIRALGLERPVVLGCSMGGRIVLHLAEAFAREFRAVIGVEASDNQEPWYDREWLHRPDVHGGEVCSALISGLIAPQSPDSRRWETLWGYLCSGPGVFSGDLHFYREDSDYSDRVAAIDPQQCPVYLMTGEYDFSCTPEDTLRTARAIGVEAIIMTELGHFPMSENPERFRSYLLPVLEEIAN